MGQSILQIEYLGLLYLGLSFISFNLLYLGLWCVASSLIVSFFLAVSIIYISEG